MAVESGPGLPVRVLGNPIIGETVEVESRGAEGLPLALTVNDMQERAIDSQRIESASASESRTIRVGRISGTYLLRASTPTQTKTVKLLRQ